MHLWFANKITPNDLTNHQFTDENINAALQFRQDTMEGIHDPDYACKRRVLELLRVRVMINGEWAQVQC